MKLLDILVNAGLLQATIATAFVLGTLPVHAADAPPAPPGGASGPGGRPPGPPPEAVAACQGKAEGTAVSFTLHDGKTLQGVCRSRNGTLAAAPH